MEQNTNSFILWITPKEIISKKDSKKYNIYSGKLNFEGKVYDLSGFKTEANGEKPAYIRGQVKLEYNKSEQTIEKNASNIPF